MDDIIKENGIGLFAVELKETGEWLGFIGVNYIPQDSQYPFEELPLYEIGWRLIPEVWGNGLATEGATAVLAFAKKGLKLFIALLQKIICLLESNGKIGMTLYDHFELPELSKYHMLKRQVRYYKQLSI